MILLGSDGREYPFLCKPKDDLRKDARIGLARLFTLDGWQKEKAKEKGKSKYERSGQTHIFKMKAHE